MPKMQTVDPVWIIWKFSSNQKMHCPQRQYWRGFPGIDRHDAGEARYLWRPLLQLRRTRVSALHAHVHFLSLMVYRVGT